MESAFYELVDVLMERDGLSRQDAIFAVNDARRRVHEGDDPEDVLYEDFGLELDYIFALI